MYSLPPPTHTHFLKFSLPLYIFHPLFALSESDTRPTHTVRISIYSIGCPPVNCAPKVVWWVTLPFFKVNFICSTFITYCSCHMKPSKLQFHRLFLCGEQPILENLVLLLRTSTFCFSLIRLSYSYIHRWIYPDLLMRQACLRRCASVWQEWHFYGQYFIFHSLLALHTFTHAQSVWRFYQPLGGCSLQLAQWLSHISHSSTVILLHFTFVWFNETSGGNRLNLFSLERSYMREMIQEYLSVKKMHYLTVINKWMIKLIN